MTTRRQRARARRRHDHRPGGAARADVRVLRFDWTERALHWSTACLFGIVMATALALYFPSVAAIVGRRHLVEQIHLWTGIALPVPLAAAVVGPWGARFRGDLRRMNYWTRDEVRHLFTLGRRGRRPVDKFNPGQKANAIFVGCAMAVMLASGAVLQWFRFFPLSWRSGATFVHDLGALAVFVVVIGHVAFALTHRDALRSMVRGWVTEAWARRHAPDWLEELSGNAGDEIDRTDRTDHQRLVTKRPATSPAGKG
jgi:formate dehydrogenase subunit gamma